MSQNIGIGTTTPSQKLDVNGNIKISGALMPGNDAGTSGQLLMSNGTGTTPSWSSPILNPGSTIGFGKYYVLIDTIYSMTNMAFTVLDPNCSPASSISVSFTSASGSLPFIDKDERAGLYINHVEAQNGQFVVSLSNANFFDYINFQLAYIAFY